jgi:hypothetical protein
MRPIVLLLAMLLVAPACGRKAPPPPAEIPSQPQTPVGPPKISAPPGVPQELKDLVQKDWDKIVKEGNAFLAKFKEAQTAKENNDRAAMDGAIDDANKHYQAAADMWAEIAYWPDNARDDGTIDDATAEACKKWLGTYERTVEEWTKKNKGLKEFSRSK